MSDTTTLKLGPRGGLTLPKTIRETYGIETGDEFTLLDLGGVFIIRPRRSEVDALSSQITDALVDQGETFENMLLALQEEREQHGG